MRAAAPEERAFAIGQASGADLPVVLAMLAAERLPTADIDVDGSVELLVARDGTGLVGAIGLERFGRDGLLRSLIVREDARRRGIGAALTRALETHARAMGCESLVLLTTTAADLFAHLGYARIDRSAAPARIRDSAEFRELCPATAVCMVKRLEGAAPP